MCIRCDLQDRYGELMFLEPEMFDHAIVGVSLDNRVLYDAVDVVEAVMEASDLTREQAHMALEEIQKELQRNHRSPVPAFMWIDYDILEYWAGVEGDEHEDVDE